MNFHIVFTISLPYCPKFFHGRLLSPQKAKKTIALSRKIVYIIYKVQGHLPGKETV